MKNKDLRRKKGTFLEIISCQRAMVNGGAALVKRCNWNFYPFCKGNGSPRKKFRYLQKGRLCQSQRSSLVAVVRVIECFHGSLTTGFLGILRVLMGFLNADF